MSSSSKKIKDQKVGEIIKQKNKQDGAKVPQPKALGIIIGQQKQIIKFLMKISQGILENKDKEETIRLKHVLNVEKLDICLKIVQKIKGKKMCALTADRKDICLRIALNLKKKDPNAQ